MKTQAYFCGISITEHRRGGCTVKVHTSSGDLLTVLRVNDCDTATSLARNVRRLMERLTGDDLEQVRMQAEAHAQAYHQSARGRRPRRGRTAAAQ